MQFSPMKAGFLSLIRHSATFLAGILVSYGYARPDDISDIVGGAVALMTIVFAFYEKRNVAKIIATQDRS